MILNCSEYVRALKDELDTGVFWSSYKVFESPADGHCLLHSVTKSFNAQHGGLNELSLKHLISMIKVETLQNESEYLPVIENMSIENLTNGLHNYIVNRRYDTSFGDLIPVIVSNALKANIIILEKLVNGNRVHAVENRSGADNVKIIIHKTGYNYDAIVLSAYENKCKDGIDVVPRETLVAKD